MPVKVLHARPVLAAAGPPSALRASDALPIASGRRSTADCARAAYADRENVVTEIVTGRSLPWTDPCPSTLYRFCGRGEMPVLPGPAPRL